MTPVVAHFLAPLLEHPNGQWRLRDVTSGREIATHVHTAFDSRTRREGLLGAGEFAPGSALVIAPSNAVHTWFMRFPIDLLFVDRAGRVVKARHAVPPWRLAGALRAFAVIELPAGALAASATQSGHEVRFFGRGE